MGFKQEKGSMKMNQERYITKLLDRFDTTNCKLRTTPCEQRLDRAESSKEVDPKK